MHRPGVPSRSGHLKINFYSLKMSTFKILRKLNFTYRGYYFSVFVCQLELLNLEPFTVFDSILFFLGASFRNIFPS